MRGKSALYFETRPSLQQAKDACEIQAVNWLRGERYELNKALELLGKE
jgi:hypothetical protein